MYVCLNFFIEVDQLIIVPKHRVQLKFEATRWVKQALHKQNEIENIVILIMTNKFVKSRFLM